MRAGDFTSYNLVVDELTTKILMKKKDGSEYTPKETISFVFPNNVKGKKDLKNAAHGQTLLKVLTGKFLKNTKIKSMIRDIPSDLFPKSTADQERLSVHIFGENAKNFISELIADDIPIEDEDDDDDDVKTKIAAATKAYEAAVAVLKPIIQNIIIKEFKTTTVVKDWGVFDKNF